MLSFTQPLLRGSGVPYNTSRIVLARIDTRIAWDRLCVNVQDHLVRVAEAYWRVHLERARLMQQQRFYAQAQVIMDDLEGRRSIDSLRSQVVRAKPLRPQSPPGVPIWHVLPGISATPRPESGPWWMPPSFETTAARNWFRWTCRRRTS